MCHDSNRLSDRCPPLINAFANYTSEAPRVMYPSYTDQRCQKLWISQWTYRPKSSDPLWFKYEERGREGAECHLVSQVLAMSLTSWASKVKDNPNGKIKQYAPQITRSSYLTQFVGCTLHCLPFFNRTDSVKLWVVRYRNCWLLHFKWLSST
jgi:hypothetical protein